MSNPTKKNARLVLKPFLTGGRSREQVVIRRTDAPVYLCLSNREYDAILQIAEGSYSVQEWLGSHLSAHQGLAFSAAVELLLKLHQSDFLFHASPESIDSLKTVLATSPQHQATWWQKTAKRITGIFDFEIFSFTNIRVNSTINQVVKRLQTVYGLALVLAITVVAGYYSWPIPAFDGSWIQVLTEKPEVFLWHSFVALSLSGSILSLTSLFFLASHRLDFLPASLRLTAFSVLNFRLNDEDAWMLFRKQIRIYRGMTLIAPWFAALICRAMATQSANAPFLHFLAAGFAFHGFAGLCPLYRGALVRAVESIMSTNKIYHAAGQYLSSGLIVDLFRKKSSIHDRGSGSKKADAQTDAWAAILATIALAWLYGAWLILSNTLLDSIPALVFHATAWQKSLRAASSVVLLAGFGLGTLMTIFKLLEIPVTNLSAAARIPLRKVRRGIMEYKTPTMTPNEAIVQFLRNIPILGHIPDESLTNLISKMKLLQFGPNENIITQGDQGREFFILADGQAKVLMEGINRDHSVLDVLLPGDSFGEIALLTRGKRTASVRTTEPSKVLAISVDAFDKLFPDASPERTGLTSLLRSMKLVQESQALSHLPPRQIRELVTQAQPVKFNMGDTVIREGEEGDAAYLIESGSMLVTKTGKDSFRAELSRGSLVGAIALVNDSARTATVTATEDSTCLKIDRDLFLKICLSNVLVATLVADMASSQIEELEVRKSAKGKHSA